MTEFKSETFHDFLIRIENRPHEKRTQDDLWVFNEMYEDIKKIKKQLALLQSHVIKLQHNK